MKTRLLSIIALGLICACSLSAQTTTYNFSWTHPNTTIGGSGSTVMMNVPDINTTQATITKVGLANGCGSDQVYSYDQASLTGPAFVVGEWVKVVINNLPGYSGDFQIVMLTPAGKDPNGNPTDPSFTVNRKSCFSGGSGTAWAGSSANPLFSLIGYNCDPSKSTFAFTLLHSDGSLSYEISGSNTVTCSKTIGPYTNETVTASFSGTLSTGQTYTGTFTASGYIGECRCLYSGKFIVTSAQWSITTPTPVDTLVGGGTGSGGH